MIMKTYTLKFEFCSNCGYLNANKSPLSSREINKKKPKQNQKPNQKSRPPRRWEESRDNGLSAGTVHALCFEFLASQAWQVFVSWEKLERARCSLGGPSPPRRLPLLPPTPPDTSVVSCQRGEHPVSPRIASTLGVWICLSFPFSPCPPQRTALMAALVRASSAEEDCGKEQAVRRKATS